jgi:hypothetical protein
LAPIRSPNNKNARCDGSGHFCVLKTKNRRTLSQSVNGD